MIRILLPHPGIYNDIVIPLRDLHGAEVDTVSDKSAAGFTNKSAIVKSLLDRKVLTLARSWTRDDAVLVIGWHILPVLLLIKLGLVAAPRKLISLGCFVHSITLRRTFNVLVRLLKMRRLYFVTFSQSELENLAKHAGIPRENLYPHLWRQDLWGAVAKDEVSEGDYIFSGGYSNRDYSMLIEVLRGMPYKSVLVASKLNQLGPDVPPTMKLMLDTDEHTFEKYLAGSRLVVIPLKSAGDACGQSVLLRVLRNEKPLIITRQQAVEEYLGSDYPGYVPANDPEALEESIKRAYEDNAYRQLLAAAIARRNQKMSALGAPHEEFHRYLTTP